MALSRVNWKKSLKIFIDIYFNSFPVDVFNKGVLKF